MLVAFLSIYYAFGKRDFIIEKYTTLKGFHYFGWKYTHLSWLAETLELSKGLIIWVA